MDAVVDPYAGLPPLPQVIGQKRKRPPQIAEVVTANCTGCKVCIPFCPVDCIETVPPEGFNDVVIPPVRVRYDECIGCELCAKACQKLTWNAIQMVDTDAFEAREGVKVSGQPYGWPGIARDASHGPTASAMYKKLVAAKKIKMT